MKKNTFIAASVAALAFTACTENEYIGEVNDPQGKFAEITFTSKSGAVTRAEKTGAEAATLLGKNFVVGGWKGASSITATGKVFDHYNVSWTANTAGTTESNSNDWEYVGVTTNALSAATSQTIKYWDYSQKQYDFMAYSTSNATVANTGDPTSGTLVVTGFDANNASTKAYTVAGADAADFGKFYLADLVTVQPANYGKPVKITFKNLTAKVRIGIYETIPGYSVKDVKFYESNSATAPMTTNTATLFSTSEKINKAGTFTVYYPTLNNSTNKDNNVAHVSFAAAATGGAASKFTTGSDLIYSSGKLGVTSNTATYGKADKAYTSVLPNESMDEALTLRVNYTLVSDDGTGETITVYGAKAIVPAKYCQWKPNYAYTYLFKISDNTNGKTIDPNDPNPPYTPSDTPEGLFPITFDAIVAADQLGNQETVTTVATPSITTYSPTPQIQPTTNNEYLNGSDIYVMVHGTSALMDDLASKGKLYTVAGTNISEATVMDAAQMNITADGVINGRNGITLTPVNSITADFTTIPGVDGNIISITAGQAAKFTASTNTYAFIYDFTTGTPTATSTYYKIDFAASADKPTDFTTNYYVDADGTTQATDSNWDNTDTQSFYKKYTNNGHSYAVKVIKVQ